MSDGAMDGARQELAFQKRQSDIDQLFKLIADYVDDVRVDEAALAAAFDIFDQARFVAYGQNASIERTRPRRRLTFLEWMKHARRDDHLISRQDGISQVKEAWAEILSLGLLFASPKVMDRLQWASWYRNCKIALFAPNGYEGRSTRLYGDLETVLEYKIKYPNTAVQVFRIIHDNPAERGRVDGINKMVFIFVHV